MQSQSLKCFLCPISSIRSCSNTSRSKIFILSILAQRTHPQIVLKAPTQKLFPQLSSIIVLKKRGFASSSSFLSNWDVRLKANDEGHEGVCSVSWELVYRASLFGFDADALHQACDGNGRCVVVVQAENRRMAAAYNEFRSERVVSYNRNGLIVSINKEGSVGLSLIGIRVILEIGVILNTVRASTLISVSQVIATRIRVRVVS